MFEIKDKEEIEKYAYTSNYLKFTKEGRAKSLFHRKIPKAGTEYFFKSIPPGE